MIPNSELKRLKAERDALPHLDLTEAEFLAACTASGKKEEEAVALAYCNKLIGMYEKIGEQMIRIKPA